MHSFLEYIEFASNSTLFQIFLDNKDDDKDEEMEDEAG
jgi:hypothetical protein